MATKFYLRATTQTSPGTLPASNVSVSATTPTQIGDSGTNRSAELVKGALQTSITITTNGTANAQPSLIGRFVSDPLAAQTMGSQNINISIGGSEANAGSNFQIRTVVALWRPSTGAKVGLLTDLAATATLEPGTSETSLTGTTTGSTSQTSIDGDVLVFEVWRDSTAPGATTARTNIIFFDGTTEASTTTNAAFINLGTSTLKFMGTGFGQAQADIKATTNAFAQAQADIKVTSNSFAQAQARITAFVTSGTTSGSTAQTITLNNLQIDDLIIANGFYPNTASLNITFNSTSSRTGVSFNKSGTTNTINGKTFYVPLGVSSVTITFTPAGTGSFLAQAAAFRAGIGLIYSFGVGPTNSGTGTNPTIASPSYIEGQELNFGAIGELTTTSATAGSGYILVNGTNDGLTRSLATEYIDTVIATQPVAFTDAASVEWEGIAANFTKNTVTQQFAQAQAKVIAVGRGFAQALALINGSFTSVVDTFTRTTANGWGTADTGGAWTISTGTNSFFSTSGTEALISNIIASEINSLDTVLLGRSIEGYLKFKFDALPTTGTVRFNIRTFVGSLDDAVGSVTGARIELSSAGSLIPYSIIEGSSVSGTTISYTPGDYYWVKFRVLSTNTESTSWIKVWKDGNAEPGWDATKTTSTIIEPGHLAISSQTIGGTGTVSLTLDNLNIYAVSPVSSGQAQAQIKAFGVKQFAQAQADIKVTTNQVAQAQATIVRVIILDTFTRTTTTDQILGQADSGNIYSLLFPPSDPGLTDHTSYTDGSVMVAPKDDDILANINTIRVASAPNIVTQIDILVPSDPFTWDPTLSAGYGYQWGNWTFGNGNNDGVNWTLTVQDYLGPGFAVQTLNFAVTASTWYTVKTITPNSTPSPVKVKIWARGTQEPDWMLSFATTANSSNTLNRLSFYSSGGHGSALGVLPSTLEVDNLYLLGAKWYTLWFGQAQADIKQTYNQFAQAQASISAGVTTTNQFAQAQADIKVTSQVYAQSQADINATSNVFAQSQADIKATTSSFAQAQADIKATSNTFAQAQADTKAVTNVFGQAQADIKAVTNVFAQAQSDIKVTSNVFAQSQADIKVTTNAFSQAQADIKQTGYSFAQAQACVKGTAFAQAQADIKQIYQVFAQAQACIVGWAFAQSQADIKQTYQSYANVQADIKVTSNQFAQAQSDIKVTTNQFAQSQADIKQVSYGFAQAQACVKGNAFGQAQADIKQIYQVYANAQADIKQIYLVFAQANADIKAIGYGFGQTQAGIKAVEYGFGQAQSDILTTYQVYGQAQAEIKQVYQVYAQAQSDILVTTSQFAQANSDIKATSNAFAQSQAEINQTYQVYSQAQAEIKQTYQQYAQAQSDITQTYQQYANAQADILITNNQVAQGQARILATYNQPAQAQADILASSQSYAQAQAKINAFDVQAYAQAQGNVAGKSYPSGQAQAKINAFGVNSFGQAQGTVLTNYQAYGQVNADINATSNSFGQAQSDILVTQNGFAQSQADILAVNFGFGQAQTQIKVTSFGFAQAEADILVTSYGFGQANADIKAVEYGFGQAQAYIAINEQQIFGQAQADIKAVGYGFGQAEADIKTTYLSFAQAQATVLTGTFGWSQANADIKATSQVYAQAQTDIKVSENNVWAQANALIYRTEQSYGQANADIRTTTNQPAQANADIKVTANKFAQAQSDIKVVTQVWAQANAQIRQTEQSYAQAQSDIKAISRGYGQAQADLQATYNASGQAKAQIKAISTAFGQSQAYIKLIQFSFAQAQATIKGNAFAQAQTWIRITTTKYANAQAEIKISVSYSGQANSWIKTQNQVFASTQTLIVRKSFKFAQAQAQLLNAGTIGTGQAQAYILKSAGYAQAQAQIIQVHQLENLVISDRPSMNLVLEDHINDQLQEMDSQLSLTLSEKSLGLILSDRSLELTLKDRNYVG